MDCGGRCDELLIKDGPCGDETMQKKRLSWAGKTNDKRNEEPM